MRYFFYSKCACEAVTVHTDAGDYSCYWRNRKKYFPGLDFRKIIRCQDLYSCDYCCNHYGLDLCGCGSGNLLGRCDNKLPECQLPMQKLGEYTCITAYHGS